MELGREEREGSDGGEGGREGAAIRSHHRNLLPAVKGNNCLMSGQETKLENRSLAIQLLYINIIRIHALYPTPISSSSLSFPSHLSPPLSYMKRCLLAILTSLWSMSMPTMLRGLNCCAMARVICRNEHTHTHTFSGLLKINTHNTT